MNIVLFEADEIAAPLSRTDVRAVHILEVLRRSENDTFDAGIINGPRGKAHVVRIGSNSIELRFEWGAEPPPLDPITLIIGLPRPQTVRKILNEATALGVSALHFVSTERGEPSYAMSTLWTSGEWRRHLVAGAAQAFCTRLPDVTWARPLAETIGTIPPTTLRLALDNYEAGHALDKHLHGASAQSVVMALGSERGWTSTERDLLRAQNFQLVHLGQRVLRTETAAVAAITLAKSALRLF